ncbi:hypothetical protein RW115_00770 [Macrococcus capreoli]
MKNSNKSASFTKYFILFSILIALISNVIAVINFLSNDISNGLWSITNKGLYYFLSFVIQAIILLLILFLMYQFMQNVESKDYFNVNNSDKIFLIATLTVLYGGLNMMKDYLKAPNEYKTLLDTSVDTNLLLIILSIATLTYLIIYDESKKIKEENDLTI